MSAKHAKAARRLDLPEHLVVVLERLSWFADCNGKNARPGIERLCLECNRKPRQVKTSLKELKDLRLIDPTAYARGGKAKATVYDIHIENGKPRAGFIMVDGFPVAQDCASYSAVQSAPFEVIPEPTPEPYSAVQTALYEIDNGPVLEPNSAVQTAPQCLIKELKTEEEIPPPTPQLPTEDTTEPEMDEAGVSGEKVMEESQQPKILSYKEGREFFKQVKETLQTFTPQRKVFFGTHEENIVNRVIDDLRVEDIEDPYTLFLDFLKWTNIKPYDSSKLPIWDAEGVNRRPYFCKLCNLLDKPARLRGWLGDVTAWVDAGRPEPTDPNVKPPCEHDDLIEGPGTRQECRKCHAVLREEEASERWLQPDEEFSAFKAAMTGLK